MTNLIFDKTDKGREEIATRKHQLALRLRTLLLLIDGKQSIEEILKKVAGLGLNQDSITELLNNGFLQQIAVAPAPAPVEAQPSATENNAQPGVTARSAAVMPDGETQFQAIYHFYTQTIKSIIGLRGYALQLKVERAGSIEEFRELRRPYLEAVLKAKGNEIARSLRTSLDELLYYGETAPPSTTIIDINAPATE
jgi:hypothetical protein